jgi:CheY-like chemotaxis protein
MPFIVAIEPDAGQAAILARTVREQVGASLAVVSSKDEALAAIAERVPDLVLLSVLLSPRDEAEIVAHLRTLNGAVHLQTLTIPRLGDAPTHRAGRWRAPWRRARAAEASAGCDPHRFGEEIAAYLARADAMTREARLPAAPDADAAQSPESPAPAAGTSRPAASARDAVPSGTTASVVPAVAQAGAATDVAPPDVAANPVDRPRERSSQTRACAPASTCSATGRAARYAPLAIWAREARGPSPSVAEARACRPGARGETHAILGALDLPAGVAFVGVYDCRIRRVVTSRPATASLAASRRDGPLGDQPLHAVA